jgi:hypothetical protein
MKKIISEISQEERNRILEMHKKSTQRHYLQEQIEPETIEFAKKANEFISKFKGKRINFYLPEDTSLPIISQFRCNSVTTSNDGNEIYFDGKSDEIGSMRLMYTCDGSNIFSVDIQRFENNFLNKTIGAFWDTYDVGIDDKWKKTLKGYVDKKSRTINKVGMDLNKEKGMMFKNLAKNFPRPLVQGGSDQTGTEMIKYIQDFLCSTNKSGIAVPKADIASTNTSTNQDMA